MGKQGDMGGNGGKCREMGGDGELLHVHHGKCMKMFQQERKMEENGVETGAKWVKNGTWSGNFCLVPGCISPIFPKGRQFPYVNRKSWYPSIRWEHGETLRYPGVSRQLDTSQAWTHVCLTSAWSDGPDQADSLNTTYLSRVGHISHAVEIKNQTTENEID